MSDNRISWTPIIVGAVIALLGILTGLYIADHAREQLAQATAGSQQVEDAVQEADDHQSARQETELTELPPLDPMDMVVVEENVPDVPEVVEEPATEDSVDDATDVDVDIPDTPIEVDDFEEVPPEELEESAPQQDSQETQTP